MCRWFPSVNSIKFEYSDLQRRFPELAGGVLINEAMLEGVTSRIYYGEPFHETTLFERAAILLRDIISEHPFSDGNKRVAFASTTHFLYKNGLEWSTPMEALIQFGLNVASGVLIEIPDIAQWIQSHTRAFLAV